MEDISFKNLLKRIVKPGLKSAFHAWKHMKKTTQEERLKKAVSEKNNKLCFLESLD